VSLSEPQPRDDQQTRRTFLISGASVAAASTLPGRLVSRRRAWWQRAGDIELARSSQLEALRVLGRSQLRLPGSLPDPSLPTGADTLPQIEHVVVLVMENHSYDNLFGMLGRAPGQRPRGDGFTLGRDGLPTATNPYPDGRLQRAFRMPTTCQLPGRPSQEWATSHNAYDDGALDGFVRTTIDPATSEIVGAVAMGYWTAEDLPLTYSLASTFPIADRWFCSVLGQTDPNRRFLIAATSSGMTDDIGTSPGNAVANSTLGVPAANGTIFQRLSDAGITWADYNTKFPTGATLSLYPANDAEYFRTNAPPISQFFSDAEAGNLPQFSLLDPDYGSQSQENPQNIAVGEGFLGRVLDALRSSPLWRKTLFILVYDEHGGYYDHVPPPAAITPDGIPPAVNPGESTYDGFARYGFRVPAVVVSPYARRGYVSHRVYDHTSILAFLERKWNLTAMTYRDANANDLRDFLDLQAMSRGKPTFPELPALAPAGDTPARLVCSRTGPGQIPPPSSAPGGVPPRLEIVSARVNRRMRGLVVELQTNHGSITNLEVQLAEHRHVVAHKRVARVGTHRQRVVLRDRGQIPPSGRYTLSVRHAGRTLARRAVVIRKPRSSGPSARAAG
jgi:phospholipase C